MTMTHPAPSGQALLPCPFCGSKLVSLSEGSTGTGAAWFYIECEDCAGMAEPDVWNRRAIPAQPQPVGGEPVAWIVDRESRDVTFDADFAKTARWPLVPLYAHPPASTEAAGVAELELSDASIDALAEATMRALPDGTAGFLKSWGYRQFARSLLDAFNAHQRASRSTEEPT